MNGTQAALIRSRRCHLGTRLTLVPLHIFFRTIPVPLTATEATKPKSKFIRNFSFLFANPNHPSAGLGPRRFRL